MNIPEFLFVVMCDDDPNEIFLDEESAINASKSSPCPGPDVVRFKKNGIKYKWDKMIFCYDDVTKKYARVKE